MNNLVSVLTPCYNSSKLIHRLLDSVLNQTYPNIEMIIIDDGSTDDSAEVIKGYIPRFEAKGYQLSYYYQDNSGQSVAINKGLKLVQGKYLVWPDSDDYYASVFAIEKMVKVFESASEEIGIVRVMQNHIDENTMEILSVDGIPEGFEQSKNLFEDCIFSTNGFYWGAGGYMVRTRDLRELTGMEIYTEKDAGQNWQLFLPVFYKYRCLTIKEVLYNIIERSNSHSRGKYNDFLKRMSKIDTFERVLNSTLNNIKDIKTDELQMYLNQIKEYYLRERIKLAYVCGKRKEYIRYYNEWSENFKTANYIGNKVEYWAVCLRIEPVFEFIKKLLRKSVS